LLKQRKKQVQNLKQFNMKIKEYFLKLKEQGKIKNEDYDKFVETVPEGEMINFILGFIACLVVVIFIVLMYFKNGGYNK